jgi:FtsP/CotA-like multicopper oxidase with cupredoxin domain
MKNSYAWLGSLVVGHLAGCIVSDGSIDGHSTGSQGATNTSSDDSKPVSSSTFTIESSQVSSETNLETSTTSSLASTEPEIDDSPGSPLRFPAEAVDLDPQPDVVEIELRAAPHTFRAAGHVVNGYAYNAQVPGPTIRIEKGKRLRVRFRNDLDEPTTIHWHGLDVPYEMDGAAWREEPIPVGGAFTYEFVVEQEGTYWYHPHYDTARQVDLGLYGAIVVVDPAHPKPDRDLVFVLDTWGEWEPHTIRATSDLLRSPSHGQVGPLTWTVNGQVAPILRLASHERIRARFINVSNSGYADLRGFCGTVIASDQGLLAHPAQTNRELLAPADRADLSDLCGDFDIELAPYSIFGPGPEHRLHGRSTLLALRRDLGNLPLPLRWPHNEARPSDDPKTTDVLYVFHGDPRTDKWMINGETFPDVTIRSLPRNRRAIIEVRNLSASEHPFHLHGQRFEVLSVNGIAPEYRTLQDNWNLKIRDTLRVAIEASNPGYWMAHCHILPHAHGMMTVLHVQ